MATIDDFEQLDIRVGKVLTADDFPEAKRPAYKLTIDFGPEIGIKKSSVQIVENYKKEDLIGRLVMGVVNFPPRQVGPFMSETLTLGVPDANNKVILIKPDGDVPLGGRLY